MSRTRWLWLIILLSLLLHVLVLWWLDDSWLSVRPPAPPKTETVFVDLKEPPQSLPIAVASKPAIEEIPDKPSAQGLYSQKVKEETVSPTSKLSSGDNGKKAPRSPRSKPTPAQKPEPKQPTMPTWRPEESQVPKPTPQKDQDRAPQKKPAPEARLLKEERLPGFPDTAPGVNSGGEYRPNFKMAGRTYMNILSNPKIFYFVELKRKLQLAWSPQSVLRGGRSGSSVMVVLAFSISSNGRLIHATVLETSRLPSYDGEAKRAVTVSAPFSPPPAELLKEGRLDLAIPFTTYFQ